MGWDEQCEYENQIRVNARIAGVRDAVDILKQRIVRNEEFQKSLEAEGLPRSPELTQQSHGLGKIFLPLDARIRELEADLESEAA